MKDKYISLSIPILLSLSLVIGVIGVISKSRAVVEDQSRVSSLASSISRFQSPGIGYIRISGPIHMGAAISPMIQDSSSSEMISNLIYSSLEKTNIKALLIRINSPGGTVAATQEIYNAVAHVRSEGILTVASIGDLAASGGYYIASACDVIFANPGSLTGSIGVIINSINLKKFLDNFGIAYNTFKGGKYKDILSFNRKIKPEEYKMIQAMVDSTYKQFLLDVSKGRKLSIDKVRSFAEGKIFNGDQAKMNGMIDRLGDFNKALHYAHKKANLPGTKPNLIPLAASPWEQIFSRFSSQSGFWDLPEALFYFLRQRGNKSINLYKYNQGLESGPLKGNYSDGIIRYQYLP